MMGQRLVAIGQMTSTSCHRSNLAQVQRLCEEAVTHGARLLCIPEAFAFIGGHYTETVSQAQALDGPLLREYRGLAEQNKIWLSLGGYHEAAGDRVFNTHIIVDEHGRSVVRAGHQVLARPPVR